MDGEILKYNKRGSETIPLKFLLPFWSTHVKNSLLYRANLWNKLIRKSLHTPRAQREAHQNFKRIPR